MGIGSYPTYKLYIFRQANPDRLIEKHAFLKNIHSFLWSRCYFNSFNYAIASFFRKLSDTAYKYIERKGIDALNHSLANHIILLARQLRKTHTGVLSYNMLTFVFGVIILLVLLLLFGV